MKRNQVALVVSVCFLAVTFVILSFVSPFRGSGTTVSKLCADPEIWLGERVEVQGTLRLGLGWIPEEVPPFNCLLEEKDCTVGVLWEHSNHDLDDSNVTVVGVVRKGQIRPLIIRTVYYIEAETVKAT